MISTSYFFHKNEFLKISSENYEITVDSKLNECYKYLFIGQNKVDYIFLHNLIKQKSAVIQREILRTSFLNFILAEN